MSTINTPYHNPDPPDPPDPTALGLSNARSPALQTILLNEDIPTFLKLFHIPIPSTLPTRIDIPRGTAFPCWILHVLRTPHEALPPGARPWDVRIPPRQLYNNPLAGREFPHAIWSTIIRPHGTYPGTVDRIDRFLSRVKLTGSLLYRGTSRWEARMALAGFVPAPVECTDLGEGMYTSWDPQLALAYAGDEGVVWVFSPDWTGLDMTVLDGVEWEMIAGGTANVVDAAADVVVGAVSDDRGPAGMQGCVEGKVKVQRVEGGAEWACWRSERAWGVLAKGLVAMVFLDRECVEMEGFV